MDHRTVLAALPAETRSRLTTRSNAAGLRHLAAYVAALLVTGTAIAAQVPFWPVFLLPHCVLLAFLFTLSHECTHQTPFRTAWLNDLIGHLIAPILGLPFIWFRYFHLAHHRFTNDPKRDPELSGGGHPDTRRDWLIYLSGWRYWRGAATTIWANARGHINAPYLPAGRHGAMRREARLLLAVYALALISLAFSSALFWLWLLPVLIGQPVLRAYLLAEHGLCPQVADMLDNTRTTFTTRLVRFLAWNMPYHAEHHAFPSVAFHQLPALHAVLAPHLKQTSPGYASFTKTYATSLKS